MLDLLIGFACGAAVIIVLVAVQLARWKGPF